MGFNTNDAKSFDEMAEEQAVAASSAPAEPVAEVTDETTEPTVGDKPCDCNEPCADEDCTEAGCDCTTPKAE